MSYMRVIPRDLFNEANLLKCYGQIYLNLEKMTVQAELIGGDSDEPFEVVQNEGTGGITLRNVLFKVRGERCDLERSLNARNPFPLYLTTIDDEEISVSNDDGSFSEEMISFRSER